MSENAATIQSLVDRLINDEKAIAFLSNDALGATYLRTYPEFLRYFCDLPSIQPHHVIIGASFTYGWIPRILRLHSADFEQAARILNRVKVGAVIDTDEMRRLVQLIDRSVVAVSKLLHFVNPALYGIWDGRVFEYIRAARPGYSSLCSSIGNYLRYMDDCRQVIRHPAFAAVTVSVSRKMGYEVTPMRAAEVVMFMCGVKQPVM